MEGRGEQGAFAVGFQNAQFDPLSGRRDAELIAHRHLDEGRDVKQFFLLLPNAGIAEFARLYQKHVSVDVAKSVADLIDQKRKFAAGAGAEIHRQRIEGVTEQPRVAQ
ncbi:MAG: hypothetical protein QOJ15_4780 [Bradyrhizobium sp.]|jgi:hypothetical protein|nr:hypothetical protein [Bradyrhizobium sp.]